MSKSDTTPLTAKDILQAQAWYKKHKPHVERLMSSRSEFTKRFPPHGSDCARPELWKSESWLWFRQEGFLDA